MNLHCQSSKVNSFIGCLLVEIGYFQIVLEHANTLELQNKCLKICEIGAEMRLLYTTALFNDYVKNDLSLEELETAA